MAKNINIEIPDEVHKQLKLDALTKDKTLKEVIIRILESKWLKMANINIKITDEIHKKLKIEAIQKETTLKDLIIEKLKKQVQIKKWIETQQ